MMKSMTRRIKLGDLPAEPLSFIRRANGHAA
jgi:hypothetical protein